MWQGKDQEMNKKLYIGNLASGVTEEELRGNFSTVGNIVSLTIIRDKFSGLSKGFGFVEMETEEAAKEAVTQFNGGELHGKVIVVNEARPQRSTGGPRGDGRPRPGGFRRGPERGGGGRRY
jgi:RNA recognition motif-containing protein